MPSSRVCVLIDLPPEPLWDTLIDFRTWNRWLTNLNDSIMEDGIQEGPAAIGIVRGVGDPQNPRAREKYLACDEQRLEMSYTALGSLPFPARNYVARVKLIPLTDVDQTVIEWSGQFDADQTDEDEVRITFVTLHRKFVDYLEVAARALNATLPTRNLKQAFELRQQEPPGSDPRDAP